MVLTLDKEVVDKLDLYTLQMVSHLLAGRLLNLRGANKAIDTIDNVISVPSQYNTKNLNLKHLNYVVQ